MVVMMMVWNGLVCRRRNGRSSLEVLEGRGASRRGSGAFGSVVVMVVVVARSLVRQAR